MHGFARTMFGAVVALGTMAGAANATLLTGTYTIDVYNGYGGGNINAPGVQALPTNPLIAPGTFVDTVTYTGALNFGSPPGPNTIIGFLSSAGGVIGGIDNQAGLDGVLSTGGFDVTTIFVIHGTMSGGTFGTVEHDDGISIEQGGVLVVNSSFPTSPIETNWALNAGAFTVYYAAANGLPEELQFTVIPEPASLALLGAGLLGLGALRRRRRVAA